MFASVFIIGSFWFWLLFISSFVLMVMFVEVWDRPFSAGLTAFVTLALLDLLGDLNLIEWILANPLLLILAIVGYFITGTCWSFVKWYIFVRDRKEAVEDFRHKFKKKYKLMSNKPIPENKLNDWYKAINNYSEHIYGAFRSLEVPVAREYKERILVWATYWPWSMAFSLMADLVRQLFTIIYAKMSNTYQKISNTIFGDIANEFVAAREYEEKKQKEKEVREEEQRKKDEDKRQSDLMQRFKP
jgi:hypothetical protein